VSLFQLLILGAILALIVVSAMHSVFGEKMLLKPMFKLRGNAVLDNALARKVLRFAWHSTSLVWLLIAIFLYVIGFTTETLSPLILSLTGITFLAFGIIDCIVTRGRHMGWAVLTAIGLFCLGAYAVMGTPS